MLYVNPLEYLGTRAADASNNSPQRRKIALQELEHLFTFTLLQEMRKSVPPDPLLGNKTQRSMYDEMLDDALSGAMARSGQLGIAKQIGQQLRQEDMQKSLQKSQGDQTAGRDGQLVKSVPHLADNE